MSTLLIASGIVALVALNAFVVWFLVAAKRRELTARAGDQSFTLLQRELQELVRTVDGKLAESSRLAQESGYRVHASIEAQFSKSERLIQDITRELTEVKEGSKQVASFASQLQSLQDVLQNPKRRGVLGEYYLETVLKNVLPASVFKMQYLVGKSEEGADLIVDAAIFIQDKVIPVDSKFSLENYNRLAGERDGAERLRLEQLFKRDLKARIDETSKYIAPHLGTMDFALMFIPSEAIFYDLIINHVGAVKVNTEELIQYAAKKRVNIVSPNSFYAFLQVILHGLRQVEIEKNTEEIRKRIGELGRHLKGYEDFYNKLGKGLSLTVSHYEGGRKALGLIDKDITRITGEGVGFEVVVVDRPDIVD
jgi:DNA recombination protein RmuC